MSEKFIPKNKLSEKGRNLAKEIGLYIDARNKKDDFLKNILMEHIEHAYSLRGEAATKVSRLRNKDKVEDYVFGTFPMYRTNYKDCDDEAFDFILKYIDVDSLKCGVEVNKGVIRIYKMIGYRRGGKLCEKFGIKEESEKKALKDDTNFIQGYLRFVYGPKLKDFIEKNDKIENCKMGISSPYCNSLYTNIDFNIFLSTKDLNSDILEDIKIYICQLNDYLENELL